MRRRLMMGALKRVSETCIQCAMSTCVTMVMTCRCERLRSNSNLIISMRTISIVVCGDEQTGKSSLVSSASADLFDSSVPPVLPPTLMEAPLDQQPYLITDTSSSSLDAALAGADAVIVCFDATRLDTLTR